ncbi:MAG: hypothetical protein RBG13Loki_0880 [Promethearchaeota archaeon CR_4]|nr:MAG: hypothetical protein RBG13Loki_0880 [Candidatus Lokiarchaeota archaeon CR_4]
MLHASDESVDVRAQNVITGMGKEERLFVKDLPIPRDLSVLDVPLLIRNGWVAHVGKWCVLTPRGGNVTTTRDLSKEVLCWFHILAQVPKRSVLANLEQKGIIENRQGFPLLTIFGQVVKEQIKVIDDYVLHHSWRLPSDARENAPRDQV